jgi:Ca2+-transporting ATPase
MDFYNKKLDFVFSELGSTTRGLSSSQVSDNLKKYGPNEIKNKKEISPLQIFLEQFKSFIIWILIFAAVISAVIGEWIDAAAIAVILIVNAVLGFVQEYKAEKAIEALKKLASLKAVVLRDGIEKEIDATELVPGDIVILVEGEKVPADCRLFEIASLQTQEASLTGESTPVEKRCGVVEKAGVADRWNMVFAGTVIVRGRGRAVVTATGMQAELGKIAGLIQEAEDQLTPLQIKLKHFGMVLGIATLAICAVVFAVGVIRGLEPMVMFLAAVSLAVAAVPEGLPAVVTITLALGVQRMIKRNTLVRKLPSVETLGSTTVICSDKTGTFTHNQMTVQKIYVDKQIVNVTGEGYSVRGGFSANPVDLPQLLKIGALCNDAHIQEDKFLGDPTEAALIVSAAKLGIHKAEVEKKNPRIGEVPFSSERKMMSTAHTINQNKFVFAKGSAEVIIKRCNRILEDGKVKYLSQPEKDNLLKINDELAEKALRVLAFAYKEMDDKITETNLIFVGLQAMIDPARNEAVFAVKKCEDAGIKVVMITGDHKLTARAVAAQLGIKGRAVTGEELDNMSVSDLQKQIMDISIYARVNPAHKVRIVDAFKKQGHIVAMTGDGVNDAPSIKRADIGVAMGITGTDVAKEAADMILVDDNFASLVSAVEEGRTIFDNIQKFVEYLLSCNLGEVMTIFTAILIGLKLPLIAIQILIMNLLTDGFPALALGVERREEDVMARGPRKPGSKIVDRNGFLRIFGYGALMMVGTLLLFNFYKPDINIEYAQTVAFTTLVMFQMFHVLNCRSIEHSLFKVGLFSNMKMWYAIAGSIAVQAAVIYLPFGYIFGTVPLTLVDWAFILLTASSVFIVREIQKLFKYH